MAILKVARMGHPVLRMAAEPIADPTAPEVVALVRHMIDTLADADGVGLAAPQVHVPARLVVYHIPSAPDAPERYRAAGLGENSPEMPLTVLINPEIELLTDDSEEAFEGCLSVPGMTGMVRRPTRIRYRAIGLDGGEIERTAEGFHARVVQHECDHLDGILFPQRMTDLTTFGFMEEVKGSLMEERKEEEPENG
jgi:peptide deformylase